MVDLSRIMRQVALDLYTQPCEMDQKLHRANTLDKELEHWLEQAPSHLRSGYQSSSGLSLTPRRLASYIKKQAVVLRLRKHWQQLQFEIQLILTMIQVTSTFAW